MAKVFKNTLLTLLTVTTLAFTAAAQPASRPQPRGRQPMGPAPMPQKNSSSSQYGQQASASADNSTSASASAGPASAGLSTGTDVHAQLVGTVDARKCHPGQKIIAKTTQDVKQNGRVVLRKGTKLIGHITEVQARTKANAESSIGIAFDQAVMRNGTRIPFRGTIQALAVSQLVAESAAYNANGTLGAGGMASVGTPGPSRGGLLGGAPPELGATTGDVGTLAGGVDKNASATLGAASSTTASVAGNAGGLNTAGHLTSASRGVFGLQGLQLESWAQNATQGSVITSASRNVHLADGTQMLLNASAQ